MTSNSLPVQIDLAAFSENGAVRNLAGKERGRAARVALGLDNLDHENLHVEIKVPAYISAITDSFLLGLLSRSISSLGGLPKFHEHYQFVADNFIKQQIFRGLERAAAPRLPIDF